MSNRGKTLITISILLMAVCFPDPRGAGGESACPPTQNDVEGPYYVPGAPFRTELAAGDEPGERIVIRGKVLNTDCKTPVKDALIEVWQTDAEGKYHYEKEGFRLRGRMKADTQGDYEFSSVKPGRYRIMHGFRPAHIHIKVSHADYEVVTTQIYFRGDPYLAPNDACGRACRSDDPRRIIALESQEREGHGFLEGTFTIFLQPSGQ